MLSIIVKCYLIHGKRESMREQNYKRESMSRPSVLRPTLTQLGLIYYRKNRKSKGDNRENKSDKFMLELKLFCLFSCEMS